MYARSMLRRSCILVLSLLAFSACKEDRRSERIDKLQKVLAADRDRLARDAETRDPTRPDLKANWAESSIMQLRETANPERPWVAYVRVRWHFKHADGREIGDSVFDYVYALDPQERWMKADDVPPGTDTTIPPEPKAVVVPSGGPPA